MKKKVVFALFTSSLLAVFSVPASSTEVVVLGCRSAGFVAPVRPFEVDSCSVSAGASVSCPVKEDPNNYSVPGPSCSQALADFMSAGYRIEATQPYIMDGTMYTLVGK